MAKKFTYKGHEADKLKELSLDEFMKIIPSRSRRTLKRMSPKIKNFIERMRAAKKKGKRLETHARNMPVLPEMIGMQLGVHNGKEFVTIMVTPEMVGRRLGEFSHTTKLVKHSGPGIGATRGSKAVELK
jgi:small subunit ribosomal protein S19